MSSTRGMSSTREGLAVFEEMLDDIGKQNNPRPHKRLKFLGRELLEWQLVEVQLLSFFEKHFDEVERLNLLDSLTGAEGECRVCECLLALMYHAEKRIDKHQEVFHTVIKSIKEVRDMIAADDDDDFLSNIVNKSSLLIYDSFHGLCAIKRVIRFISKSYKVPYYYDIGDDTNGAIRIRSSLLSTYKNLNIIIDDLVTLGDALWVIRNYDLL